MNKIKILSFSTIVSTLVCFLILFGLLIVVNRLNMLQQDVFEGFFNQRYLHLKTELLIHVLFGLAYFLLTPLLILNRARNQSIKVHRFLGSICLLSGFILGIYSCVIHYRMEDGVLLGLNGWVSSVFFLLALSMALYHIKQRHIAQHRAWMIRAFSMALGAFVVVRVFSFITFTAFTHVDLLATNLVISSPDEISLIQSILFLSSWAGTIVPLLIGELVIKNNVKSGIRQPVRQEDIYSKEVLCG